MSKNILALELDHEALRFGGAPKPSGLLLEHVEQLVEQGLTELKRAAQQAVKRSGREHLSRASEAIREAITAELGRGVTVLRGHGGMSGEAQAILYCVVTRLEVGKVKQIVRSRDAAAFVTYHALAGAEGGIVKKVAHH